MASKIITLTSLATGIEFNLSSSKIVKYVGINSGANSELIYIDNYENTLKLVKVVEDPTTIEVDSANTFPLTLVSDGSDVYLNAEFLSVISETGSGSTVKYDSKKTAFDNIVVTQTPAAILATVNAL
jgi:hypothetical protein